MEKTKKNDFVELKFIGRTQDGEIFDTNISEEAKKIGMKMKEEPFIICIGKEMVVTGLDKALEDKELEKEYSIDLEPKEAFGERRRELVKLMPLKVFTEKNIRPEAGMTLHMDYKLVRIASVSGGRVLVDFNNPLSGKELGYKFTITKKITSDEEKIKSLVNYFIKQDIKFEIKDKKAIFEIDATMGQMISMLNEKFKDILGIELIVKENKKEEKEPQDKK